MNVQEAKNFDKQIEKDDNKKQTKDYRVDVYQS